MDDFIARHKLRKRADARLKTYGTTARKSPPLKRKRTGIDRAVIRLMALAVVIVLSVSIIVVSRDAAKDYGIHWAGEDEVHTVWVVKAFKTLTE